MLLEPKRNFLKAEDVQNGTVLEFVNEGEWVESKKWTYEDGSPRQQFIIRVKLGDAEKDLSMNSTSRTAIMDEYGRDTADWVGKRAVVELVRQNVGGALKSVIYLTPEVADV